MIKHTRKEIHLLHTTIHKETNINQGNWYTVSIKNHVHKETYLCRLIRANHRLGASEASDLHPMALHVFVILAELITHNATAKGKYRLRKSNDLHLLSLIQSHPCQKMQSGRRLGILFLQRAQPPAARTTKPLRRR
jgi:hypothetical protein